MAASTRPILVASPLLLLLAGLGPARAGDVPFTLSGTVSQVSTINQATAIMLSEAGVSVGAAATISFSVESTTPVSAGSDPTFSYYAGALTSLTVSIGTYTATKNIPYGFDALNFVQVGDDEPTGPPVGDSWTLTTPCQDGGMLQSIAQSSFVRSTLNFTHTGGGAGDDEGVIQDPGKYDLGTAVLEGVKGTILLTLDVGGGPGVGPGLCARGQLKAASKLGRAALRCHAVHARQPPQKDPEGEKLAACLDKAAGKFTKRFAAAVAKAVKKGGVCLLPGSESQAAADLLTDGVELIAEDVLVGTDTEDKADRVLRGKLLKAAAAQARRDLASHGKDAFKPDADKLALKLAKSRAAALEKTQKGIDAAMKKGVVYAGPTAEEIADGVSALVDSFVLLTEGVVTDGGSGTEP